MKQVAWPHPLRIKIIVEDDFGLSRSETRTLPTAVGPNVLADPIWVRAIKDAEWELAAQLKHEFSYLNQPAK